MAAGATTTIIGTTAGGTAITAGGITITTGTTVGGIATAGGATTITIAGTTTEADPGYATGPPSRAALLRVGPALAQ